MHRESGQKKYIIARKNSQTLLRWIGQLLYPPRCVLCDRVEMCIRDRIYSASAYLTEMSTARMLCDLNINGEVNESVILTKIAAIEKETGTVLDEKQKEAVIEAVRCGLLVITGGPGTGKTTTINTLISYFESEGLQILLAAPTGRAAKRMTEATGYEMCIRDRHLRDRKPGGL